MKKRGRPSKMTKITIGKLEQAISLGCDVKEACCYANIHPDTYYDWISKNKELSDRFNSLRSMLILKARMTLVNGLRDNPKLAFKFLERMLPEEFGK